MGQRFQTYVNYGNSETPNGVGENLFAMHLQWCWGPFAVIRAHQLTDFLEGNRDDRFNPFGIGSCSQVGGNSYDGRREDLYALRALTEMNLTSASIVAGHDLMVEKNEEDLYYFNNGKLKSFPKTIKMDPLAQDNNDGFLVIQATADNIKYAFCADNSCIEPISASAYLLDYQEDLDRFDDEDKIAIRNMVNDLDGFPLLTQSEMKEIFEKDYRKDLNIEQFTVPERAKRQEQPLEALIAAAKRMKTPLQTSSEITKECKPHQAPER